VPLESLPNESGLRQTLPGRGEARYTPAERRTAMMTLKLLTERYYSLASQPGAPVELGRFGLSLEDTEMLFNALDEDYQINRHLHFSKREGPSYRISGEEVTHVSMDAAIASLL